MDINLRFVSIYYIGSNQLSLQVSLHNTFLTRFSNVLMFILSAVFLAFQLVRTEQLGVCMEHNHVRLETLEEPAIGSISIKHVASAGQFIVSNSFTGLASVERRNKVLYLIIPPLEYL